MSEKREAFIQSVPWVLRRPNFTSKPFLGQWKVLNLPQEDLNVQEFYHV
jgi:hypothetical protein